MKLARGSLWVMVLFAMVITMAFVSVQSTSESEPTDITFDEWEDGFEDDYSTEEETSEFTSQEYSQQPAGPYGQLPLPPNNYVGHQQQPPQYYQPAYQQQYAPPSHYQPAYPTPQYPTPQYQAKPEQQYQSNYSVAELSPAPAYQPPPPQYQPASVPYSAQKQQPYKANYTPSAEYAPSPAPTYQPQQPSQPQPYHEKPQVVYQAPASQPVYQPAPSYQQAVPKPTYPAAPAYSAPTTPKPYVSSNYSAPNVKPAYAPPVKVANYSSPPQQQQPYHQPQKVQYNPAALARKYSYTDLAPLTSPYGYRSNHWSLNYYRTLDHLICPKPGNYNHGPTLKDVQDAFATAIAQLGYGQQGMAGYQPQQQPHYLNMSVPSFAARHQIASYISQNKNARMDEEGLLVEFVSAYLADRLCLSKWDRQRYLPSLTKLVSSGNFPQSHTCSQYYSPRRQQWQKNNCYASKYRTYDGFCNNPWHPYWGKSDVCHIRLLSPDYADGISRPREGHNARYGLPNPRLVANVIHSDVPVEGPYNLMKMQWGQFINHDISNTALSSYDGLVDCCKNPKARGCWPIIVPPSDHFYGPQNVTCLNFIRSGVCPTCQLGPRQQTNKNTAFLDASHVYGNNQEQAMALRAFVGGMMKTSSGKNGEQLLPVSTTPEQCFGVCYKAGDSRVNQHPALTALHVLLLRNHNRHAQALARHHPNWNDELIYQEARRLNIAEYQMITYGEYLPIVFGPILSAYYKLTPAHSGHTYYDPKVDPTTWNEYTTAACRFGHSQISSLFALTTNLNTYNQPQSGKETFRLKDWFFRPSLLAEGKTQQLLTGLLGEKAQNVDPWVTVDVRNYLYKGPKENFGGDLAATNIWRGRDHGLPGYVHYVEYCFNYKVRSWKDLQIFIPNSTLGQMRKLYKVVENIDLFSGGMSERHFPGADIGPTFACINGIQYYHLKFGDRYFFEHAGQAGSFNQAQIDEIRRSSLARLLCRAGYLSSVPQFAFMQGSQYNPIVNCTQVGDFNYNLF